ncbi:hypothetical protein AVEN_45735-1, partial [Araneus ventricosus]
SSVPAHGIRAGRETADVPTRESCGASVRQPAREQPTPHLPRPHRLRLPDRQGDGIPLQQRGESTRFVIKGETSTIKTTSDSVSFAMCE